MIVFGFVVDFGDTKNLEAVISGGANHGVSVRVWDKYICVFRKLIVFTGVEDGPFELETLVRQPEWVPGLQWAANVLEVKNLDCKWWLI